MNRVFLCRMYSYYEKLIIKKLFLEFEEFFLLFLFFLRVLIKELWKVVEIIILYYKIDELLNGYFCIVEDEKVYIL